MIIAESETDFGAVQTQTFQGPRGNRGLFVLKMFRISCHQCDENRKKNRSVCKLTTNRELFYTPLKSRWLEATYSRKQKQDSGLKHHGTYKGLRVSSVVLPHTTFLPRLVGL